MSRQVSKCAADCRVEFVLQRSKGERESETFDAMTRRRVADFDNELKIA